jgi:large subunit ribosomal protein L5
MADDKAKQKKEKAEKAHAEKSQHGKGQGSKPSAAEIEARRKSKQSAKESVETADEGPAIPAPPARLMGHYRENVIPALKQSLNLDNALAVPRLDKIVISMGLGKAVTAGEKGKMEQAEKELGVIAGQRPVRCKAKKSVANFKVREGQETGLKVTLRGGRMYEFLDRVISLAIPRVKDFRGLPPSGFDRAGNYNFGFTEQTVFPEVDGAAVTFQQGMNVTICTTAKNPTAGRELLKQFGFPFRVDEKAEKTEKEHKPAAKAAEAKAGKK